MSSQELSEVHHSRPWTPPWMVARLSAGGTPRSDGLGPSTRPDIAHHSTPGATFGREYGRDVPSSASSSFDAAPVRETLSASQNRAGGQDSTTYMADTLPREVEGLDISTYANLKHAFEIIVHSYKLQKEALEANRRRWGEERQDLLAREQNLVEALTAVREALDAETAAHDKDLETLEKVMLRNSELDQQLRSMHKRVLEKATLTSTPGEGGTVVSLGPHVNGVAVAGGTQPLGTSGLSSSLRVLAGAPVQQRYDADTDSYQLVARQVRRKRGCAWIVQGKGRSGLPQCSC